MPRRSSPVKASSGARRGDSPLLRLLKSGKDVRRDKVRRVRAAIRSGVYENDLKLSVALDRLLRDAAE